jgi:hypothetical protein
LSVHAELVEAFLGFFSRIFFEDEKVANPQPDSSSNFSHPTLKLAFSFQLSKPAVFDQTLSLEPANLLIGHAR